VANIILKQTSASEKLAAAPENVAAEVRGGFSTERGCIEDQPQRVRMGASIPTKNRTHRLRMPRLEPPMTASRPPGRCQVDSAVSYKITILLVMEREIRKLELQNGRVPFDEWFESLRDKKMQAAVDSRIARATGNFGDTKSLGEGVFELRIHLGPRLRIYFAILFAGAIRDPVRNIWIIQCGLIMCALVPVPAGICIPARGVPLSWFWIDSAFAPAAASPLWIALRGIRRKTAKRNCAMMSHREANSRNSQPVESSVFLLDRCSAFCNRGAHHEQDL
jgi:putative component of toxin-antitoxin plasmid stabilization module